MSQTSTHRTTFHQYIRAGVQASLARVQAAENIVPEVDRQQAWHILSFAIDIPEVWDVTRMLLLTLAPKMEFAGFRKEWVPYLEQGIQMSQQYQDYLVEAELSLQIGILHRLMNEFSDAQRWLTKSCEHFSIILDQNGEARALNELAWVENLQQNYFLASEHAEKACTLVNDPMVHAMSYRVLGMIAHDQAHWDAAEMFHRKALKLFQKQRHKRFIAWGKQNLAATLNWQEKFYEAIKLYRQAAKSLLDLNDRQHAAIVLMNLALSYQNTRQFTQALKSGQEAEEVFQGLSDKLNLARVKTNLGLIYYHLKMFELACNSFKVSSQYHAELGNKHLALNALDGYAMSLIALKCYAQALVVLNQAVCELPTIADKPNYVYLQQSLTQHLQEAQSRKDI